MKRKKSFIVHHQINGDAYITLPQVMLELYVLKQVTKECQLEKSIIVLYLLIFIIHMKNVILDQQNHLLKGNGKIEQMIDQIGKFYYC
jgi:hypothetical protein